MGPVTALPGPPRRLLISLSRETALIAALFALYSIGRMLAARRTSGAFENAHAIWDVERWLGLPSELTLQNAALAVPELARAANAYYAGVHFPLTAAVLLYVWVRSRAAYRWARGGLVMATGAGLVVQVFLPTAPPRMLTELGFVDTGLAYGHSVYGPVGEDTLSNQFASMPSMHVGWAVLVAMVLISSQRSRWRWLWALHPAMTLLVVTVTAHHFWLDGALGAVFVLLALAVGRHAGGPARTLNGPPPPVGPARTPQAGPPCRPRPAPSSSDSQLLSPETRTCYP